MFNEDGSGKSAVEDEDRYVEVELSTDDCPTAQEPPQVEPQAEQVDSDLPTDSAQDESTLPQPVVRRSTRQRHTPDYFGRRANVAKGQVQEAHTVEGVLSTPEKAHWLKAMENKMKCLQENDVWELVQLPSGRKPVGSKWIFKVKTDENGKVERYKARLVAQGFTQKFGADYDETFSPVVRLESLRTLIALSVQQGLQLYQVDVTTAFLNGRSS